MTTEGAESLKLLIDIWHKQKGSINPCISLINYFLAKDLITIDEANSLTIFVFKLYKD